MSFRSSSFRDDTAATASARQCWKVWKKKSGEKERERKTRHVKPMEQEKCISGAFYNVNEIYLYSNQHMHITHNTRFRTLKQFLFLFILFLSIFCLRHFFSFFFFHLVRCSWSFSMNSFGFFSYPHSWLDWERKKTEKTSSRNQRIHFHSTRWQWWLWWLF